MACALAVSENLKLFFDYCNIIHCWCIFLPCIATFKMTLNEQFDNKFEYVWKISNYLQCSSKEISLLSPIFTAYSVGGQWYLKLLTRDENNKVSCWLYRNDASCNNVKELIISAAIVDTKSNIWSEIDSKRILFGHQCFETVFQLQADSLVNEMSDWSEDLLTIRLFMQTRESLNYCEAETNACSSPMIFDWHSTMPTASALHMQTFIFDQNCSVTVILVLCEDNILVKIKYIGQQLSLKFTLLDIYGAVLFSKAFSHTFHKVGEEWTLPCQLSKFHLLNQVSQCLDFLGRFHLRFEFFLSIINRLTYSFDALSSSIDVFKSLNNDFSDLLSSKKHADMQLRIDDNKTFSFHKCLLAARSPVFAEILDRQMLEGSTDIVDIDELDENTLNSLMYFIYTGSLQNMNFDSAFKLFMAANKYKVLPLREKCVNFLLSALSIENACDLFETGDTIGHYALRQSAFDHIILYDSEVLGSPKWSSWLEMNPKLGREILRTLSDNLRKEYE